MERNAEGYLSYGFLKMEGVTCKKGDVTFTVDLSYFGDPDSAYGMLQTTDKYLGHLCVLRKGRHIGGYAISQDGMDPAALSKTFAGRGPGTD
jgi:hypothetical protein